MGDIIPFPTWPADARQRMEAAPGHPALRWTVPVDGGAWAHRRAPGGGTRCGADGDLELASARTPLCPDCAGAGRVAVE
jgi:hypothetical protein